MSIEIYPKDVEKDVSDELSLERHLCWVIEATILPQLPSMQSTLESLMDQLGSPDGYKLPISSYNSEQVKGIITRTGFNVTELNLNVKINKVHQRFNLKKDVMIRQLLDCYDCIDNCISGVKKLLYTQREDLDHNMFIKILKTVIMGIKMTIKNLNEPNIAYSFPLMRIPNRYMDPKLPNELAIDVNMANNELCVDVYSLKVVTQFPWNVILDKQRGVSFIDRIRSRISKERSKSIQDIIKDEHDKLGTAASTNIFNNFFRTNIQHILSNFNQYIDKCITVEDSDHPGEYIVAQIEGKQSVVTNDPMILSISIKLNSLEKAFSNMLSNLDVQ